MPTYKELSEQLDVKRKELKTFFDTHKNAAGEYDMTTDDLKVVNDRNAELEKLGKDWLAVRETEVVAKNLQDAMEAAGHIQRPEFGKDGRQGDPSEQFREAKSLGQSLIDSKEYKGVAPFSTKRFQVELENVSLKTTMTSAAGYPPFSPRGDKLVLSAQRRPMIADLIPQDDTPYAAIKYMEETTFTNAAASTAEAAASPESALAYTERTIPVEKISTFIPVTEEQVADTAALRGLIDSRLRLMISLKEEDQILNGSGTSPQLQGFYNKSGIQTQALGVDPVPDAIYKAMTKVRWTGYADPTGVVLHPNDWQDIRLLRTADGLYIWGNPAEAGPETIWGLPVIATTAATENTGLTGDFQMYAHISRRLGITIAVSDSHGNNFIAGILAIRADSRLSLEIYRASAFCTVTGI